MRKLSQSRGDIAIVMAIGLVAAVAVSAYLSSNADLVHAKQVQKFKDEYDHRNLSEIAALNAFQAKKVNGNLTQSIVTLNFDITTMSSAPPGNPSTGSGPATLATTSQFDPGQTIFGQIPGLELQRSYLATGTPNIEYFCGKVTSKKRPFPTTRCLITQAPSLPTNTFGTEYLANGFVTPDNKLVISGSTRNSISPRPPAADCNPSYYLNRGVIVRINNDGTWDTTFQNQPTWPGRVMTEEGGCFSYYAKARLQNDGKYAVAVEKYDLKLGPWDPDGNKFGFWRINPDGALDNIFGTGGKTAYYRGMGQLAFVHAFPNNRLLWAGTYTDDSGNWVSGMRRFLDTGLPDSSLGTAGFQDPTKNSVGQDVKGASKYVPNADMTTRFVNNINGSTYGLGRTLVNGPVDHLFNPPGKGLKNLKFCRIDAMGAAAYPCGYVANFYDYAIQADGKVVLIAAEPGNWNDVDRAIRMVRYNADGTRDNTFNGGEWVTVAKDKFDWNTGPQGGPCNRPSWTGAVRILSTGKILVAFSKPNINLTDPNADNADFGLTRYNTDGTVDATYGTNGTFTANCNFTDPVHDLVLYPDDRAVVMSKSTTYCFKLSAQPTVCGCSIYPWCMVRVTPNGQRDVTFADNGRLQAMTCATTYQNTYCRNN